MEKNHSSSGKGGKLSVVGTGPGSLEYLTPRARRVIEKSDIVVGYKTYLDLIEVLLFGKEIVASAMMQEVDRVKKAIELAVEGKSVALISGGDPGIYAMAGLAFEVAKRLDCSIEIEIIAGIAALNSCAERLGAPLMHDFATISLSDLLTPWELIEKRLKAAAEADFVIVIYNPRSKKRAWQLDRACEIISQYRVGTTPVGVVKGATRAHEEITVTRLDQLDTAVVDMQSTVIVGNSNTYIWNKKMITPRGYSEKYNLEQA